MWSRRDACESITTRRRLRPLALPPPADEPGLGAAGCLVAGEPFAGSSAAGLDAACAPSAPVVFRALSASDSSTLDAATLASIPAALRAASTSLLLSPCCLAIS